MTFTRYTQYTDTLAKLKFFPPEHHLSSTQAHPHNPSHAASLTEMGIMSRILIFSKALFKSEQIFSSAEYKG